METSQLQARIDAVKWYHEFDFGNGLQTRTHSADLAGHRPVWRFIEEQLESVDFRGKRVLDIGAWDGYWSFYAERRGAKSVLATDDRSQNWSDGQGLLLARELYGSAVHVNQDLSIYQLTSLREQFDIILCLGVYYHLLDPFYAFAQIRHCCHSDTLVVIEGPEAVILPPGGALYNLPDHHCEMLLTREAIEQMLRAAYFSELAWADQDASTSSGSRPGRLGWRWRLRLCAQVLFGSRGGLRAALRQVASVGRRFVVRCAPFVGVNELHAYRPPFGLHDYDSRFRENPEPRGVSVQVRTS
jgi:tRNA (mo5U34)-methyltransferase